MFRVIVIYDSKTGFTEMMAEAVAEGARKVESTEVELLKAGTAFSLFRLDEADAIILGSPNHYGDVTQEMRTIIESAKRLKKTKRLKLSGKIGGVFISYAWDRRLIMEKLTEEMKTLGIKIVVPTVCAVDKKDALGIRIKEVARKRCRRLGRTVATALTAKSRR